MSEFKNDINKKEVRILSTLLVVLCSMATSSCNNENKPSTTTADANVLRNSSYGSRYIPSTLTDDPKARR